MWALAIILVCQIYKYVVLNMNCFLFYFQVGLSNSTVAATVIVDQTPPEQGEVSCSQHITGNYGYLSCCHGREHHKCCLSVLPSQTLACPDLCNHLKDSFHIAYAEASAGVDVPLEGHDPLRSMTLWCLFLFFNRTACAIYYRRLFTSDIRRCKNLLA